MRLKITLSVLLLFVVLLGCSGCDDDNDPPEPGVANEISATNGLYYRGTMNTAVTDNPMTFTVVDGDNQPLQDARVDYNIVIGDGTLVDTFNTTNVNGQVTCQYMFDGSLGHAVIQAVVGDIDSMLVYVRANTLIPGATGQGQYVLMDDRYEDVVSWNGLTGIDTYSGHPLMYVNYEDSLGVVVVLDDADMNQTWYDTSSVKGVIVNSIYNGKIDDSIGIGSSYQAVVDYYGAPDTMFVDIYVNPPDPPDTSWYIRYAAHGLTLYSNYSDTLVNEIHLSELVSGGTSGGSTKAVAKQELRFKKYNR